MAAVPAGGKRRLAGHGYACDRWRRSVRHRPPLSWDPRTQTPSPLGSPARCSPDTPRCGDSTADLGPQYARGRGERAAPEGAERRLSGAPRSLGPLGPGPSVLLCARWREGVGAGPSEVDFHVRTGRRQLPPDAGAAARRGVYRGSRSWPLRVQPAAPVPAALPWEPPVPPLCLRSHWHGPATAGRAQSPAQRRRLVVRVARWGHLRVVAHAHYLTRAESGEILLLLPAALSCAASGNPIFSSSAVYTTGSGETSGTCPLSVKRFVKCHIHNALK